MILTDGLVAQAELVSGDLDDVVGVGVVLGEDQRLGDVLEPLGMVGVAVPVGEHHRIGVPQGGQDGADLVLGHDLAVEFLGVVVDVVVDQLLPDRSGLPVPERGDQPGVDGAAGLGDLGADAEHVEVDVDPVGHGLFVVVLQDQVLVEEPEGLLARRGGEADEEGVEVLQHLPPHPVDRAVALVDDDHVVGLDRHLRVVDHLDRPIRGDLVAGLLVELGVEGLVPQDRVHPLDGGDVDLGDRVELVRGQALHVVQLGELAAVVGGVEALELLERLPAQVGPVDQEQDPARTGVADQPVGDVGGGERLARPGRHLDQRPGMVVPEATAPGS